MDTDRSRREFLLTSAAVPLAFALGYNRYAHAFGRLLLHEKNSELFFFRPQVDIDALQKLLPSGFRPSRHYVDVIAGVKRVTSPEPRVIFHSGINAYVKDGNGRDGWFRPYVWSSDDSSRPVVVMRDIFGRGSSAGMVSFRASGTQYTSTTLDKQGNPVLSMSVDLALPREDPPFWRHSKDIFSVSSSEGAEVKSHHTIVDIDEWRDFVPGTARLQLSGGNANLAALKLGQIEGGCYVRHAAKTFAPDEA